MAMDGIRLEVDTTGWEGFMARYQAQARQARLAFLQRGGEELRTAGVREAVERFGRETAESHMQSVDPSRPKGIFAASIRVTPDGEDAVVVGPNVPHAWWASEGSRASQGIPATHRSSLFTGHRPMSHGAERVEPFLPALLERLMQEAARAAGA